MMTSLKLLSKQLFPRYGLLKSDPLYTQDKAYRDRMVSANIFSKATQLVNDLEKAKTAEKSLVDVLKNIRGIASLLGADNGAVLKNTKRGTSIDTKG